MENKTLIEPLEKKVSEQTEMLGKKDSVKCGFCLKEIPLGQEYTSPGGYKYCDSRCFTLFTED